ncbi:hypothetical protein [Streptomyces sp. NPDC002054]|uniref:hypothetical protein n=1 Tax=Streptomyces sp. NPDC002054 TaxID=3154663 RepID=UPI00331D1135
MGEKAEQKRETVSGNGWPVVPLVIASLLLRIWPEQDWAEVTAAVIGGAGALAALYGISECVRAARRERSLRGSAALTVVLLLLAITNWARAQF